MELDKLDRTKQLFTLTIGEFIDLVNTLMGQRAANDEPETPGKCVYGIAGIAEILNCSISTANRIKKSGVIDKAITQRGRLIMVDVELAKLLYDNSKKKH
jgi:hypothetical protein